SLRPLRPRRSTLFPYTTLFRSQELLPELCLARGCRTSAVIKIDGDGHRKQDSYYVFNELIRVVPRAKLRLYIYIWRRGFLYFVRSEEHTSELQSRFDIVCRLLL